MGVIDPLPQCALVHGQARQDWFQTSILQRPHAVVHFLQRTPCLRYLFLVLCHARPVEGLLQLCQHGEAHFCRNDPCHRTLQSAFLDLVLVSSQQLDAELPELLLVLQDDSSTAEALRASPRKGWCSSGETERGGSHIKRGQGDHPAKAEGLSRCHACARDS